MKDAYAARLPGYEAERNRRRLCRSCGEDLGKQAQYSYWTLCPYCYWKQRTERAPSLGDLLKERGELKARKKFLPAELAEADRALTEHGAKLEAQTPLWRRILGLDLRDDRLARLVDAKRGLESEAYRLEGRIGSNKARIDSVKHCKKRFAAACRMREARRKGLELAVEKKKVLEQQCADELDKDFERSRFRIRKKDYKRGNLLDNHCRKKIEMVVSALGNACLFCGGAHDLVLDHYAIPKNEGGNFALYLEKDGSLKLNVVVLCRSCNSMKGETDYRGFFDKEQRRTARKRHEVLLSRILSDKDFMAVIRKWYGGRSSAVPLHGKVQQ